MDLDFLIPVTFFVFIGAIIIVPQILRSRERARMHETLRTAYEKGQPVPPELVEALSSSQVVATPTTQLDRAQRDLRVGIVWLFVGLGFVAVGAAFYAMLYNHGGSVEVMMVFSAFGAIPGFIGLAFLVLSALGRGRVR